MEGRKKGRKKGKREEGKVIAFSQMIIKTTHGIIRQHSGKKGGIGLLINQPLPFCPQRETS